MVREDCGHIRLDTKCKVQDALCVLTGCPCVYVLTMSLNPVLVYNSTPHAEDVWGMDVKLHVFYY